MSKAHAAFLVCLGVESDRKMNMAAGEVPCGVEKAVDSVKNLKEITCFLLLF